MKKPPDHHVAKVQDAINVLKSRGGSCYKPDVAAFVGNMSVAEVDRVYLWWESEVIADPTGKREMPWQNMEGKVGGFAITPHEKGRAIGQRDRSIISSIERQLHKVNAEYLRTPDDPDKALLLAETARRFDRAAFDEARALINERHLEALMEVKPRLAPADIAKAHTSLMTEVDQI